MMPAFLVLTAPIADVPPLAPPAPVVPISQPRLRNAEDIARSKHYPRGAMRVGAEGAVRFVVDVSRKGRPFGCRVTESSGNALLDTATCRQVLARARFDPARDQFGKPIVGANEPKASCR